MSFLIEPGLSCHREERTAGQLKSASEAQSRSLQKGRITCDHLGMGKSAHVTLSGDIAGDYIVKDERPDGELTLVPDTSAEAILGWLGHTPATLADLESEYGPVLPADGEG